MTSEKRKYRGIEDVYAIEDEIFSRSKGDSVDSNFNIASTAVPVAQTAAEATGFDVARRRVRRSLWMIEELEHAVQLVPNNAEKYYCLGLICIMTGRFKESFENLGNAVEIAPEHMAALNLLGELNLKFARYDKAVPVLEKAVTQEPDNMMAIIDLCLAYYCLGEKGQELAQQSILQLIAPDLLATTLSKQG